MIKSEIIKPSHLSPQTILTWSRVKKLMQLIKDTICEHLKNTKRHFDPDYKSPEQVQSGEKSSFLMEFLDGITY